MKPSLFMKFKTTFFALILLLGYSSSAQINIGSEKYTTSRTGNGELKAPDFKKIKRTTLVIFYGDSDSIHLEGFKEAIKSWTFCPIILDDIANLESYDRKRGFSFASLDIQTVTKVHPNLGTKTESDIKVFLNFWIKKGKEQKTFARLDLFTSHKDVEVLIKLKNRKEKIDYLYSTATAYNWSPGFLKLYLTFMSDKLSKGMGFPHKEDYEDPELLADLSSNILFYPDYILTTKDELSKELTDQTEEDLFEKYPFEKELMLTEDLDNLLLDPEAGGDYVLLYVQCGDDKYYSVYNSNGSLLFQKYEVNSYNLDKGDLKKIAKEVD
tara:strand:+ start:514 stop:1488 length:975 start_codon:yes stop_codon:yes gene_type:complete